MVGSPSDDQNGKDTTDAASSPETNKGKSKACVPESTPSRFSSSPESSTNFWMKEGGGGDDGGAVLVVTGVVSVVSPSSSIVVVVVVVAAFVPSTTRSGLSSTNNSSVNAVSRCPRDDGSLAVVADLTAETPTIVNARAYK